MLSCHQHIIIFSQSSCAFITLHDGNLARSNVLLLNTYCHGVLLLAQHILSW